jgi:predicted kinase
MDLVVVSGWTCAGKSTIADGLGVALPATVVSFDWVMSGLRSFPELWEVVELPVDRQRDIGWTLMSRIAEQQLRRGGSVVLDHVARDEAVERWRALAAHHGAELSVIECVCEDEQLHRARVEGRRRDIPGWYELTWEQVLRTRTGYAPLAIDDKLVLSAMQPVEANLDVAVRYVTRGQALPKT